MSMVHVQSYSGNDTYGNAVFSNIAQDATHLVIRGLIGTTASVAGTMLYGQLNNLSNIYTSSWNGTNIYNNTIEFANVTQAQPFLGRVGVPYNNAYSASNFELWIPNYTSANDKAMHWRHGRWDDGPLMCGVASANIDAAVTSVKLFLGNGFFTTGSIISLYKVYA